MELSKLQNMVRSLRYMIPKRHVWSKGLAGLVIKEECQNANLRDWENANVRGYIIQELLGKSTD